MLSAETIISGYKILSKISEGKTGEVYLAEDVRLHRKVLLRLLPAELTENEDRLKSFKQEARLVSELNHPNILTAYEFGVKDKSHFVVTEFIEAVTLGEKMADGQIQFSEILDISVQVVSALSVAHEKGIIHRGINPDNILIGHNGFVKVSDFGLARPGGLPDNEIETRIHSTQHNSHPEIRIPKLANTGADLETAHYLSPEQVRGLEADSFTDVFSFGIVLYEMFAGHRPFTGATPMDVITSVIENEPPPLKNYAPDVSGEIVWIVGKILRKERDERYQSAKELLTDLSRIKQRLEFVAELERTVKPEIETEAETETEFEEDDTLTLITSDTPTVAQSPTQTVNINPKETEKPRTRYPTSNAEYIISEIKKQKRAFAIAFAVLLAVVIGYRFFFYRLPSDVVPIDSIAVLPFQNASNDADVEYLSDGMTESLISSLSQLPNLDVKARGSVFRYKGQNIDLQQIARELKVQAILTGRVVQRDEELRLSLELIDVRTESVIWNEQYSRRQKDLISLQSDIARDVLNKLHMQLSNVDEQKLAKNYTGNADAYKLYLQGRFYSNKRTAVNIRKAIEYFQQSITLDPNYALAYTGLADSYSSLWLYENVSSQEVIPKARSAAQKALSLDDKSADAHISMGLILLNYDYDFAGAEREYKRAIELNPKQATGHIAYGSLLSSLGKHEESLTELQLALDIEPFSPVTNHFYGLVLFFARRYDDATTQLKKSIESNFDFAPSQDVLANVYRLQGNHAKSVEEYAKVQELSGNPDNAKLMRESFSKGGWRGFLQAMTHEPKLNNSITRYVTATFHTELGEKDKAFAELNKAYENHEFFMIMLSVDPRLEPLRADPRFQDLLRRVGFSK